RYFERFSPRTPPRRYVNGETHRYLGRQYRLRITVDRRNEVKLIGGYLHVSVRKKSETSVQALFEKWLAGRAQEQFSRRLRVWEQWCASRKIKAPELRLRKMRKRWGSSHASGCICLNPELVQAPSICIDYVIAHEVCHLKFPRHDKAFYGLLTRVCPNWRMLKERLEESLT